MSEIQSQLKLAGMKVELLKALAEVEAQESTHRQRGMFRTVDLAANVASHNVCVTSSCLVTCTITCGLTGRTKAEVERNASPALLAAMKSELKTALAEVEAQESAHRQRSSMFRTVDLAANIASPNVCAEGTCLETCTITCPLTDLAEKVERNTSPALLAAKKAELKTALAEVEAQESAFRKDDKA